MKRWYCTLPLFLVFLAGVAVLLRIRVPDTVWWVWWDPTPNLGQLPLLLWISNNFGIPAYAALLSALAIYGLWIAAANICGKQVDKVKREQ
jgi:hypothetical protein